MKNRKGFTLIELMIVVAIIAIIAAIAIPSLLNARRNSNQNAAMATIKSFSTAAVDYSTANDSSFFWGFDTDDDAVVAAGFGDYFAHVDVKSGYNFYYLSNSSAGDVNDASCYMYVALPVSFSTGRKCFYITENNQLNECSQDEAAADFTAATLAEVVIAGFAVAADGTKTVSAEATWVKK